MFEERLLLPEGKILEMRIFDDLTFVLSLKRGNTILVDCRNASGDRFKSVEKLRYDFQRDAEDALRQG